jgi:hypothetical protein
MVWALQGMRQYHADPGDLLDLFEAPKSDPMKRVAETALKKEARVYYFDPEGVVKDISGLDPGSETSLEADWGGLIGFSKRVNEIVARAVNASLSWG